MFVEVKGEKLVGGGEGLGGGGGLLYQINTVSVKSFE